MVTSSSYIVPGNIISLITPKGHILIRSSTVLLFHASEISNCNDVELWMWMWPLGVTRRLVNGTIYYINNSKLYEEKQNSYVCIDFKLAKIQKNEANFSNREQITFRNYIISSQSWNADEVIIQQKKNSSQYKSKQPSFCFIVNKQLLHCNMFFHPHSPGNMTNLSLETSQLQVTGSEQLEPKR